MKRRFKANGSIYNIPESEVSNFLKDFPDAVEVKHYEVGGSKYNIPLGEVDTFESDMGLKKKKESSGPSIGSLAGSALANQSKPVSVVDESSSPSTQKATIGSIAGAASGGKKNVSIGAIAGAATDPSVQPIKKQPEERVVPLFESNNQFDTAWWLPKKEQVKKQGDGSMLTADPNSPYYARSTEEIKRELAEKANQEKQLRESDLATGLINIQGVLEGVDINTLLTNPDAAQRLQEYFETSEPPERGYVNARGLEGGARPENNWEYEAREDVKLYKKRMEEYKRIRPMLTKKHIGAHADAFIDDKISKDVLIESSAKQEAPLLYKQVKEAQAKSLSGLGEAFKDLQSLNPLSFINFAGAIDDFDDNDERRKIFNSVKGIGHLSANKILEERINERIAEAIRSGDKKEEERLRGKLKEVDTNVIYNYPTLVEKKLYAELTPFIASKTGNLKNSTVGNFEKSEDEMLRVFNNYKSKEKFAKQFFQENGYFADPKTKEIANKIINDIKTGDDRVGDASYLGGIGKAAASPFVELAKGIGNITGYRTIGDIVEEKVIDQLIPTNIDEDLKTSVSVTRNIVNTTANVLGQAALQYVTAGAGRVGLGVSKAAAQSGAFWVSGALPAYDQAYKESMDFIDDPAGRTLFAAANAVFTGYTERLFKDVKLFDIPAARTAITELSQRAAAGTLTRELTEELLGQARTGVVQYGKKYAKNIGEESLEEVSTQIFNDVSKMIAGDPDTDMADLMKNAKETFIQTAIGTSLIGGWGAYTDARNEKNSTFKSALYNAAVYHDEAEDALRKGLQEGTYGQQEFDQKMQLLNTAKLELENVNNVEKLSGKTFDIQQKQVYIANKTAELLLTQQLKTIPETEKALIADIEGKIANLSAQRDRIFTQDVKFDETLREVNTKAEEIKISDEYIKNIRAIEERADIDDTEKEKLKQQEDARHAKAIADVQARANSIGKIGLPKEEAPEPTFRVGDFANGYTVKAINDDGTYVVEDQTGFEISNANESLLAPQTPTTVTAPDQSTDNGPVNAPAADPAPKTKPLSEYGQELQDIKNRLKNKEITPQEATKLRDVALQNESARRNPAASTDRTTQMEVKKGTPAAPKTAIEQEVPETVDDALDTRVVYNNEEGDLYQEGQTVVFETPEKKVELGNVDEIRTGKLSDLGLTVPQSSVTVNTDGTLSVGGESFIAETLDIKRDENGNVRRITINNEKGRRRKFTGQQAEDIAYQIRLREITKDNETTTRFEEFLNSDPAITEEVNNTGLSEVATVEATRADGTVSTGADTNGTTTDAVAGTIGDQGYQQYGSDLDQLDPDDRSEFDRLYQTNVDDAALFFNEVFNRTETPATAAPQTTKEAFENLTPEERTEYDRLIDEGNIDEALEYLEKKIVSSDPVAATNTHAMAQLGSRVSNDATKSAVIRQAQTMLKTLKSIWPDLDIHIHETEAGYAKQSALIGADDSKTAGLFSWQTDENGKVVGGRIDINLNSADESAIPHEITHGALLKSFGDDPVLFKQFKETVATALSSETDAALNEFAEGYAEEAQPEEYLAQLSGIMAASGNRIELPTLQKIAAAINRIVSSFTGGKFAPFSEDASVVELVNYFNSLSNAMANGKYFDVEISKQGIERAGLMEKGTAPITNNPVEIDPDVFNSKASKAPPINLKDSSFASERQVDVGKLFSDFKNENGRSPKVWIWMADQMKRGEYKNPETGVTHFMEGGLGFAFDPKHKTNKEIWASSMPPKTLNTRLGDSDFIMLMTGSERTSFNFSKGTSKVLLKEIEAGMDKIFGKKIKINNEEYKVKGKGFDEFIKIANKILKDDKSATWTNFLNIINNNGADVVNQSARMKFIETLLHSGKGVKISKEFHSFIHNTLGLPTADKFQGLVREKFLVDNSFSNGDIGLILKPSGIIENANIHDTYPVAITGEVIGIPDKKYNVLDIMPKHHTTAFDKKTGAELESPAVRIKNAVGDVGRVITSDQLSVSKPSKITTFAKSQQQSNETKRQQNGSGATEAQGKTETVRYNGQDVIGSRERPKSEKDAGKRTAKEKIKNASSNISLRIANEYNKLAGLPEIQPHTYKPSDKVLQPQIANTFNSLVDVTSPDYVEGELQERIFTAYEEKYPELLQAHNINNYKELVTKAYSTLAEEVEAQYNELTKIIKVSWHDGDRNYDSSAEMLDDVHNYGHLWVFRGGDDHSMFGSRSLGYIGRKDKSILNRVRFNVSTTTYGDATITATDIATGEEIGKLELANVSRKTPSVVRYSESERRIDLKELMFIAGARELGYNETPTGLEDFDYYLMKSKLSMFDDFDNQGLLERESDELGLTANDKFRAVHDFFGHSIEGYEFGANGEENAWIEHSKMFSPLASIALSSETRGQNSVVNYSGINEVPLAKLKLASALRKEGIEKNNEDMQAEARNLIEEANSEFSFAEQKSVALFPHETNATRYFTEDHRESYSQYVQQLSTRQESLTQSEFKSSFKAQKAIEKSNAVFIRDGGKPIGFNYDNDKVARERFNIPSLKVLSKGGSDRTVFDLGNGMVLKVAHSARGLEQNVHEGSYDLVEEGIIPEVKERGLNYIVAEKVDPATITKSTANFMIAKEGKTFAVYARDSGYQYGNNVKTREEAEGILNRLQDEFTEEVDAPVTEDRHAEGVKILNEMINDFKDLTQMDFERRTQKMQDALDKYGMGYILNYDDILWYDFNAKRNWGIKNGRPIHLDGGTFGGIRMIRNFMNKENMDDADFRKVYYESKRLKKEFGDVDTFTKFQAAGRKTLTGTKQEKLNRMLAEGLITQAQYNKVMGDIEQTPPTQQGADTEKQVDDALKNVNINGDKRRELNMAERLATIRPARTGERSDYMANDTLVNAGYASAKGRPAQGERTTIANIAQANEEFINQLQAETGGRAVHDLMNFFRFAENRRKKASDLNLEGLKTDTNYMMVNVLLSYIHNQPLTVSGLSPDEATMYNRYLQNVKKEMGRSFGQAVVSGRISRIDRYFQRTLSGDVGEAVLAENESRSVVEAEEEVLAILNAEQKLDDDALLAAEEEAEAIQEQSTKFGQLLKLIKSKEMNAERSRKIVEQIQQAQKDIKNFINNINCE